MPNRTATVLRVVGFAFIADVIVGFVFLDRHRWHHPCNGKFNTLETQPITLIATRALSDGEDAAEDPFADFDPRISPLKSQPKTPSSAASSGTASMDITASVAKSLDTKNTTNTVGKGKIDAEGGINSLGFVLSVHEKVTSSSTADNDDRLMPGSENKNKEGDEEDDPFADFDPRISPHMYPGGIASDTTGQSKDATTSTRSPKRSNNDNKIGVVLIDHGSKRESSNAHLETIAQAYQERCPPHFEVVAAHMEIAPPSIADAVEDLVLNRAVDHIVCHPYFLSPGRHVMQDIPQLVEEATTRVEAKLRASQDSGNNRKVQIVTTSPTGSQMKLMLDAVAKSVERSVKNDLGGSSNGGDGGLGFLGDVMRMMDEQLESN